MVYYMLWSLWIIAEYVALRIITYLVLKFFPTSSNDNNLLVSKLQLSSPHISNNFTGQWIVRSSIALPGREVQVTIPESGHGCFDPVR